MIFSPAGMRQGRGLQAMDFSRGGSSTASAADFSRGKTVPDADSIFSFEWTVENFGMCPEQALASPEFGVRFCRFGLRLVPRVSADGYFMSASLCRRADHGPELLRVRFRTSIGRRPFHESHFARSDDHVFRKGAQRPWNLFVTRNDLFVAANEGILPVGGSLPLTVKCDVLSVEDAGEVLKHAAEAELLSSQFGRALESGEHSDIVLLVEDRKFHVHRVVLQCRCPSLLESLKKVKHPNKFALEGQRASDVQALLKYLYTGVLGVSRTDSGFLSFLREFGMHDLLHALVHPHHKSVSVVSEIPLAATSFKWPVRGFSKVVAGEAAAYPAYLVEECGWNRLEAVMTVERGESQPENVKVTFKKVKVEGGDVAEQPAYIHCKVISSADDRVIAEEKDNFRGSEWELKMPLKDVERLAVSDVLWLEFNVQLSSPQAHVRRTSSSIRKKAAVKEDVRNLARLQADFGNRLQRRAEEEDLSDVLLRAGASEFKVHRVFLCTRSPVFARMFSDDYLERQEGVVAIEDVHPSTLFFMLRYVYSGCVKELDADEAMLLYAAADKYELLSLKERCADIVRATLEPENVGEVLMLADAHHDSALKAAVYDFIASHPKAVADCKDSLNNSLKDSQNVYPELLEELLKRFSGK